MYNLCNHILHSMYVCRKILEIYVHKNLVRSRFLASSRFLYRNIARFLHRNLSCVKACVEKVYPWHGYLGIQEVHDPWIF